MTVSPEIVAKHESFIQKYFSVVDSMDLENFKNLFLVDGTFTLGNYPAAVGHSQVGHAANGIFTVLSQIRHQVVKIYSVKEDVIIMEGKVFYTLKNGFAVDPIPFNSIYELTSDGQYIQNYRCYVDITPLNTALANNQ